MNTGQPQQQRQENEQERDIETARQFYADFLVFEARMEVAGEAMHNRGRWIEAIVALRKGRDLLQQFIGERMTADIRQAHERAQLARFAEVDDADEVDDSGGEGGNS